MNNACTLTSQDEHFETPHIQYLCQTVFKLAARWIQDMYSKHYGNKQGKLRLLKNTIILIVWKKEFLIIVNRRTGLWHASVKLSLTAHESCHANFNLHHGLNI